MLVSGHGAMFESVENHRLTKFNRNVQRLHRNTILDEEDAAANATQTTSDFKPNSKKKKKKRIILDEYDDPVRILTTDETDLSTVRSTDSAIQSRMAEQLWSSNGLLGSTIDFLAAHDFERKEGHRAPSKAAGKYKSEGASIANGAL